MTQPSCQIGIAIYRQPLGWIQQCIRSALEQDYEGPIVITVRTDGATACDPACIAWLRETTESHPNLQLIEGDSQLGTFGSYRAIFATQTTTYLCQLDADDWLEADAISSAVEALASQPSAPFTYSDTTEIGPNGQKLRQGMRSKIPFNQMSMLVQFITFHLRVIRRSAYAVCGGYDPKLLYTGDYDLSLRLCEQGAPAHIPQASYNYRIHPDNTSGRHRQATVEEAFTVAQTALERRCLTHLHELSLNTTKQQVTLRPRHGPIAVVGMHRSGTSLLALMLQRLGLNLGDDLITGDRQNPDGYGEDQVVVNLQRHLLHRHCGNSKGWPDWGWRENSNQSPVPAGDPEWEAAAKAYLNKRQNSSGPWGWKDPRTTLLLPQWLRLNPGLRVIGIYRDPWEVVEALQRVQPPIFLRHPNWGLQIWQHYNQALADFVEQHPERCILLHNSTLTQRPERLIEALEQQWGGRLQEPREVALRRLQDLIRPDRMQTTASQDPLAALHRHCSPESAKLLHRLDALATYPSELHLCNNSFTPASNKASTAELAVVITSYNQGDLLLEAVASVWRHGQDCTPELLIVDDGSDQPRTLEVLRHLSELGLRVIRQNNQGLAAARNRGVAETKAPVLLFLDDDNRLLQPYFTAGLAMLRQHPQLDSIYGNCLEFGSRQRLRRVGPITAKQLWAMNHIDNCALMRRSLLERCGGYDTELPAFEDWDLWLQALSQKQSLQLGYLDLPCFEYRVRPDSMLQRLFQSPSLQTQVMERLRQRHGNRVGHGGFGSAAPPPKS